MPTESPRHPANSVNVCNQSGGLPMSTSPAGKSNELGGHQQLEQAIGEILERFAQRNSRLPAKAAVAAALGAALGGFVAVVLVLGNAVGLPWAIVVPVGTAVAVAGIAAVIAVDSIQMPIRNEYGTRFPNRTASRDAADRILFELASDNEYAAKLCSLLDLKVPPPDLKNVIPPSKSAMTFLFKAHFQQYMKHLSEAWIAPEIPSLQLNSAKQSFAELRDGERPIAFFEDGGIFASTRGKRGVLITTHGLHCRYGEGGPHSILYLELEADRIEKKGWLGSRVDIGVRGFGIENAVSIRTPKETHGVFVTEDKMLDDLVHESLAKFLRKAVMLWKAQEVEAKKA